MEKNIRIFAFTDSFKDVATFEKLGFSSEIDDAVNKVFYVELIADTEEIATDRIQKCNIEKLEVMVILEKEYLDFTSDEYLEFLSRI